MAAKMRKRSIETGASFLNARNDKALNNQGFVGTKYGGGDGIRTHGPVTVDGFQDRYSKPMKPGPVADFRYDTFIFRHLYSPHSTRGEV